MGRLLVTLVGLVFLVTLPGVQGKHRRRIRKCSAANNEYYNASVGKCLDCDPCAIGKGLDTNVTITVDEHGTRGCYGCEVCSEGFFSNSVGHNLCLPCEKCTDLNRIETKPCSSGHGPKCGSCLSGFYDYYSTLGGVNQDSRACRSCEHDVNHPECASSSTVSSSSVSTTVTPMNETLDNKAIREKGLQPGSGGVSWVIIVLAVMSVSFGALTIYCFVTKDRVLSRQRPEGNYSCHYSATGSSTDLEVGNTEEQNNEGVPNISFASSSGSIRNTSGNSARLLTEAGGMRCFEWMFSRRRPSTVPHSLPENVEVDCCESFDRETEPISRDDLEVLRDIGSHWRDFARKSGLTDIDIEYLDMERYDTERERVYQMLVKWQREFYNEATVGKAYRTLKSMGKNELAARLAGQNMSVS